MKDRLIYHLLQFLLQLIRFLPIRWVGPLSSCLGSCAPYLLKRDSRLISSNVQRVYGLAPHSNYAQRFQQQVFRSQIAIMLETFKGNFFQPSPLQVDGMEALRQQLQGPSSAQKGVIIITAHCGSWELVARSIALASGQRFYALAKPSKLRAFTKILDQLRQRMSTDVLWTDSKNLLREMIKVLKAGQYLGFVMDQKPEGRIGPVVNFLGVSTEFVAGPAKLAIRHQCPVLAVFCMRTGPWRYKIISQVIAAAHHGLDDEKALTQAMAQAIEACIRLYPEQWLWNYKRWRLPPTDLGKSASELNSPA